MKTKFFIKSNYIKNAKNDWISCDAELLNHTNIKYFHLQSGNVENILQNQISEYKTNGNTTMSQLYHSKLQNNNRIDVLLNLNLFQSCEIKSVKFQGYHKFAIKLVPSAFLRQKKLYLIPDIYETVIQWCDVLTECIRKTSNLPKTDSSIDAKSSPLPPTFTINNQGKANSSPALDDYIALDDNDAYESSSQHEFHLVTVEQTSDSMKLNITGNYILKLGLDSLELLHVSTREIIHSFPYSSIRRFGAKEKFLRIEAGRNCTTGNGSFIFSVKDAILIAEKLKNNTRQMKLGERFINNSCMTLSKSSVSEMSFDVEPKLYGTLKPTCQKSPEINSHNLMKFPKKNPLVRNSDIGGSFFSRSLDADDFLNDKESNKVLNKITSETIPLVKTHINDEEKQENIKETACDQGVVNTIYYEKELTLQSIINIDSSSDITVKENEDLYSENQLNNYISPEIISKIDALIAETPTENGECSSKSTNEDIEIFSNELYSLIKEEDKKEQININSESNHDITETEFFKKAFCSKIGNDPLPVVDENEVCEETSILPSNGSVIKPGVPNSPQHELVNCTSSDSIHSSIISDKDSRPSSLFDYSALQFTSSSRSSTSISPTFNTLPIPPKSSPTNYTLSESTFFKYRQFPKPPIRTTPVLSEEDVESNSQNKIPNVVRSESINSQKKSPPPTFPKPRSTVSKANFTQSTFREFDKMLKNLNL